MADPVTITLGGEVIASSTRAYRVLETSHPPTVYVPKEDFRDGAVIPAAGQSWCEFKGQARYVSLRGGSVVAERSGWYYPTPTPAYADLVDAIAVYPSAMDACTIAGETVQAQDGDFYGGWITSRVVGPFKGAPGTLGW